MFNFYSRDNDKGFPGMKANVAVDTVESFAAEGGIDAGDTVIRGTDPDEQVKAATSTEDISKIIGIAVHSHKEPGAGTYYEDGDSVPVMTQGDIYVGVVGDVTAGETAALVVENGLLEFTNGASGTALPSMKYMESAKAGELARVRIIETVASTAVTNTESAENPES